MAYLKPTLLSVIFLYLLRNASNGADIFLGGW